MALACAVCCATFAAIADVPAAASGAGQVTQYSSSATPSPFGIAPGPDGALWFTDVYDGAVGRITTAGVATSFPVGGGNNTDIATGSDGALWFTSLAPEFIGRITTNGSFTQYSDATTQAAARIALGPDGAMWFTSLDGWIGRIAPDGTTTKYTAARIDYPIGIAAGPDGAMWFANYNDNSIGRITMSGQVTLYRAHSVKAPYYIAAGPDGAMWFTNSLGNTIGRISMRGTITSYTDGSIQLPTGIAAGPDGAMWYVNMDGKTVGRITTAGAITNYAVAMGNEAYGITAGPDGAMWLANTSEKAIDRITTDVTPAIAGFTPSAGSPGTKVTISGDNLGTAKSAAVGGAAATIISAAANQVVISVPNNAATGPITVTTDAGTATSAATFTAKIGPAHYNYVATEGATLNIPGHADIAFGVNGKFNFKYGLHGSVSCTTGAFGDPAPYMHKDCYANPDIGPKGYSFARVEGTSFTIVGTANVAFGADGHFKYKKNVSGRISCSSGTFGGDPLPYTHKACYTQPVS